MRNFRVILEAQLRRRGVARVSTFPFPQSFFRLKTRGIRVPSSVVFSTSQSQSLECWSPSFVTYRLLNTRSSGEAEANSVIQNPPEWQTSDEGDTTDGWEEEDDAEPEIDDGGAGGGVVFQGVPWGERALSIAHEALSHLGDDIKLYSFKTTPSGYIYIRLEKLSNEYGCPDMEELESYNRELKRRLDEVGEVGEIPDDLALEVSSPGAERLLRVPDDLHRFKDMTMRVFYIENVDSSSSEKVGAFLLESVDIESETCTWKLANVKVNRDPLSKGRPLSRKQKDWRLQLPFDMHKRVTLYLEY